MGKLIAAYAGFSATDIKNRASATSDMVVSGTNVDCTNITVTRVKNVLGSGSTAVGGLCTSGNVNVWSWCSPRHWYYTGSAFAHTVSAPYSLGSFACYNHAATPPFWSYKPLNIVHYEGNNFVQIASYFYLGEIDYKGILGSIVKIKCDIMDSGSVLASNSVAVGSDYLHVQQNLYADINTTSYNYDKTLTVKLYFADNTDSQLAPIPALADYNVVIKYYGYATIGSNNLSDSVRTDNPYWSLLRGAASIQQGAHTYIVNYNGIDSDGNGNGDISTYLQLYARKNGGAWNSLGVTVEFIPGDTWGTSGTLPFTLTYGDVVDFQLGY